MTDTLKAAETIRALEKTGWDAPSWLRSIRKDAAVRAAELGFPTTKHEEWRFTNVSPALQTPWHVANGATRKLAAQDVAPFALGLNGPRLVFVDGHFCESLSTGAKKEGLHIGGLKAALTSGLPGLEKHLTRYASNGENIFTALNTAFFEDGACVVISAGMAVESPIQLLFVSTSSDPGTVAQPRNLIVLGDHASAGIVESYASLSEAAVVTNAVTELVLGAGARLEHCKVQVESERAFHFSTVQSQQGKDSNWTSHSIAIGGRLARNQVNARLDAQGASCILNGLYLGRGEQLVDHHTVVDHAQPHCESHEFYHGILDGRARGVFNGKIFVKPHAQKTSAKQTNRNLLLSEEAVIDTKPQLEIFADDVKCTHGATVGQLDEDAIFYLQARGIGKENARRMLIRAFASDVVGRIGIEPVREELDRLLAHRFGGAD
jgi:Fe-S cluster assembly protein SufD